MIYAVFSVLAAALLALDQWSKHWIIVNLPLGEARPFLPGFVELLTVHNYGAAWSSFSGQRWLLLGVTLFSALFVCVGNMIANLLYGIVDPQIREVSE